MKKWNAEVALLRGNGFHACAISLVKEVVLQVADEGDKIPLLLQGLYAAQKLRDDAEIQQFATQILAIDPGVPSAKTALAGK